MITRGYGSDRILVDRKDMVADNCESEMSKAAEAGVKCSYEFGNSRATIDYPKALSSAAVAASCISSVAWV